jgi:hypothetical protein
MSQWYLNILNIFFLIDFYLFTRRCLVRKLYVLNFFWVLFAVEAGGADHLIYL